MDNRYYVEAIDKPDDSMLYRMTATIARAHGLQLCLWCRQPRPKWQYVMADGSRVRVCWTCATRKVKAR